MATEKIFVSMPGVPHEMKGMMTDAVIPMLLDKFTSTQITHRTLLVAGIGESTLADMLIHFEEQLPKHIKLAYLPNYNLVRLRLTAISLEKAAYDHNIDEQFKNLLGIVEPYLVTDTDQTLEKVVGSLLSTKGKTICTAESCTGGYIAHLLTSIAGSSSFYDGSIISYSYKAKEDLLQVSKLTLEKFGAVSEEVVREMALGALQNIGSNYSIAVSGIMGPGGGLPDKPVGTVWVCVGDNKKLVTQKFKFRFDRDLNIKLTAINALNLLRQFILEQEA